MILKTKGGAHITYMANDAAMDLNEWVHVIGTYDGVDTMKLYVNGKKTVFNSLA